MASIYMAKMPTSIGTTTVTAQNSPKQTPTTGFRLPLSLRRLLNHPVLKSASLTLSAATISAVSSAPALAEEMEKAKLFDFNLTLPIIAAEFLFLMFALDKIYFTPLGKFMDDRDAAIREQLNSVKDTSAEVRELEAQADAILRAARAEISTALNQMKKEVSAQVDVMLANGRKEVEAELNAALGNLEKQKQEAIRSLDSQIAALSDEIVKKVLPL